MTDRRKTPMNAYVVDADWPDAPADRTHVTGIPMQAAEPVVDLCRAPGGARDRQLLLGDAVDVFETRDNWSFLRAAKDGYVGYARTAALGPMQLTTHWVCTPATHLYPIADFKAPQRDLLSLGVRLRVIGESEHFFETSLGHVPRNHLRELGHWDSDPIEVADRLIGTPYLWGGNSRSGIDCSGLVQAAMLACGVACEGDSDLQEATLGAAVADGTAPQYGDILFWKGHVGLVAGETLLHANAGFMSTVHEPLAAAIQRIADQGDGRITAHRRL